MKIQIDAMKNDAIRNDRIEETQTEKKQLLRPLGEARGQKSRNISTAILQEYQNYEFNALGMMSVFNSKWPLPQVQVVALKELSSCSMKGPLEGRRYGASSFYRFIGGTHMHLRYKTVKSISK